MIPFSPAPGSASGVAPGAKGRNRTMGRIDRFVAFGVFALLLPSAAAFAGDMPETPYVPAPTPYEFGSGWYLRGDIGYKIYNAPDAHFDVPFYGNMIDESLSNTGVAGLGFGYKWNDWF